MAQIIVKEAGSSRTIELTNDVTSIGRTTKNDVVLAMSSVSRIHAQIKKTADGYVIADFDSRNGILFNGQKIKEKKLAPGDEIEIGEATIIFEKELPKAEEKPILIPASLSADEFIGPTRTNIPGLLIRIAVIVFVIGIAVFYAYLTVQERANQNVNLIGLGASFEQFSMPEMFPLGWQPASSADIKVYVNDREHQDGKYSMVMEKSLSGSDFYAEFGHNSIIRIPTRMRTNTNRICTFGGWVRTDTLRKSFAGYKISWYDSNNQFIRDDYTSLTSNAPEWRYTSAETTPPSRAEYGKFYCLLLGSNALAYFDNVSVLFHGGAEGIPPPLHGIPSEGQSAKENLTLNSQPLRLSIAPAGTWHLDDAQKSLGIDGELAFKPSQTGKPANMESRQSFYSKGKLLEYAADKDIKMISQIVNPTTLETLNIPLESYISPSLGVRYTFPTNLYSAVIARQFSLLVSLPVEALKFIKVASPAGIQDKSFYDKTVEKNITEIDLGMSGNIISFRYSQPVDLTIEPDADILYLVQTFQPSGQTDISQKDAVNFAVEFTFMSMGQDTKNWETMLDRADEMEKNNNPGDAIGIYRAITMEADKKSEYYIKAHDRMEALEGSAKQQLQSATDLLATAEIVKDASLYDQALKTASGLTKLYWKTEYGARANDIIQQIRMETIQIKSAENNAEAEKLAVIADGYMKEKQLGLAAMLYQQIIQKYGETPPANAAKENLEKIKELNK